MLRPTNFNWWGWSHKDKGGGIGTGEGEGDSLNVNGMVGYCGGKGLCEQPPESGGTLASHSGEKGHPMKTQDTIGHHETARQQGGQRMHKGKGDTKNATQNPLNWQGTGPLVKVVGGGESGHEGGGGRVGRGPSEGIPPRI